MISLNLIPPQEKKELALRQFYVVIKNLTILFLLFTIIVAIILLVAKIILQNNFNSVVGDNNLTTRYGRILNGQEIESFNQQLLIVTEIQNDYIKWSKFISQLSNLVPENVSLNSLEIKKDGTTINLTGLARYRDDLLKLQDSLKNFEVLSDINIPLESLLNRENIDFDIKAQINLDKIKSL